MTKSEFNKLTNEQLIQLFKDNNCSLSKLNREFGFSKDYSRKVFLKRNIDYNKIATEFKNNLRAEYFNNPTLCKNCGKPLSWENQNNKYCCISCANKDINKNKRKIKEYSDTPSVNNDNINEEDNTEPHFCLTCGKELNNSGRGLFCDSKCQGIYRHKQAYEEFLNNNDKYCNGGYTPKSFKKDFLEEQGNICAICGCSPEHNGKPLTFVLDHIDGNASNNKRENLRMICPNCDSQLDTFKSKNKNSTRRNYWKEKILRSISNNKDSDNQIDDT